MARIDPNETAKFQLQPGKEHSFIRAGEPFTFTGAEEGDDNETFELTLGQAWAVRDKLVPSDDIPTSDPYLAADFTPGVNTGGAATIVEGAARASAAANPDAVAAEEKAAAKAEPAAPAKPAAAK